MEATWEYNSRLARRSEEIGYDLTLIAELNLNDIKGVEAPSLDAWSTAAALAAVTSRLELMVAVRPTFHQPRCWQSKRPTSITSAAAAASRSTSFLPGGLTKQKNTVSISSSMTIVTRAQLSGSRSSTGCGIRTTFHSVATTTRSTMRHAAQATYPSASDDLCRRRVGSSEGHDFPVL
jgi:hypothetical protein